MTSNRFLQGETEIHDEVLLERYNAIGKTVPQFIRIVFAERVGDDAETHQLVLKSL